MIIRVLSRTKGNKTKAGQILGIPRQTLKYKMGKLGIEDIEKNQTDKKLATNSKKVGIFYEQRDF